MTTSIQIQADTAVGYFRVSTDKQTGQRHASLESLKILPSFVPDVSGSALTTAPFAWNKFVVGTIAPMWTITAARVGCIPLPRPTS